MQEYLMTYAAECITWWSQPNVMQNLILMGWFGFALIGHAFCEFLTDWARSE